jgi:ribonuclease J
MLNLTKPRYIIPIHGEFRMLVQHGRLAAEVGLAPENILILENGQPIEFLADGSARRGQPVEAGYVYVDGISVGEVGDIVLRDRRALAKDGMFLVVVTVDKQNGTLVGEPEVVTRGFVATADEKLLRGAAARIAASIEGRGGHISEVGLLKAQVKDGLSNYLFEQTRRRPLIFPVIVEV